MSEMRRFTDIDEDGELIVAPWNGMPLEPAYGIDLRADQNSVLKRLSDSWKVNFRMRNSNLSPISRIGAMLSVYYSDGVVEGLKKRSSVYDNFPRRA
jgi:hypothetical protein